MRGLFFEFSPSWWIITALFYAPWFLLFLQRKTYKKPRDLRNQIIYAFSCLLLAIIAEVIAVPRNLWTYFPNNWPIMVWINYFGAGLIGYQLAKKIEEIFGK